MIFSDSANSVVHRTAFAVSLGVAAAFFFSSTFVINRWLSVEGEHWYWTATLRYVFVIVLITPIALYKLDWKVNTLLECFFGIWPFWLVAGGIGFGVFYLALCFSAASAPGWTIATTWQLTIVFGPLVAALFGYKVSRNSIWVALVVFVGVYLVNKPYIEAEYSAAAFLGIVFVVLAAIAYPVGNTLCNLLMDRKILSQKKYDLDFLSSPFVRIWCMAIGSLPVLFLAAFVFGVNTAPSESQVFWVFYVAISTGVIATALFFYARHNVAKNGNQISAVDCTQSMEVPFALAFEVIFLSHQLPNGLQILGIGIVVAGVASHVLISRNSAL